MFYQHITDSQYLSTDSDRVLVLSAYGSLYSEKTIDGFQASLSKSGCKLDNPTFISGKELNNTTYALRCLADPKTKGIVLVCEDNLGVLVRGIDDDLRTAMINHLLRASVGSRYPVSTWKLLMELACTEEVLI